MMDIYDESIGVEIKLALAMAKLSDCESALAERDKPCVWRRADDGFFETGCNAPRYTSRAPKFCQNCGHPVTEVQP